MKISLLENGMDSLKRGFSSYLTFVDKTKDLVPTIDDYFELKQAIIWTQHGVEILLKTIIEKENEAFIVDKIDDVYKRAYKEKKQKGLISVFEASDGGHIHTISFEEAISRVQSFCNIMISNTLEEKMKRINSIRNNLTHAEINIEDIEISEIFDDLLIELDVLFFKAIGNDYETFYGFSEIKANYDKYMTYLDVNKMPTKKKAFEALTRAQEKTKQYVGQSAILYTEDISVVKTFLKEIQKDLDLGMDLYNGYCSGKTKISVKDDRLSIWAYDNNDEYKFKIKSMILYAPAIETNQSPVFIFESDNDEVEEENIKYVSVYDEDRILEGEYIEDRVVYDRKIVQEFFNRYDNDETFVPPKHFGVFRFLKRRIIGCFNVQGLSFWNFRVFLHSVENMTGEEVAENLKQKVIR